MQSKFRASILVVSTMIMGIILMTALSISLVSIKERKAAMGSNKSNVAYQTADTGIEKVMDAITKNRTADVAYLVSNLGFSCSVSNNHAVLTKGENYSVELKKSNDTDPTDCTATTKLTDIASIKAVGTGGGQQRAIEAAVASAGYCSNSVYKGATSATMGLFTMHGAISSYYEEAKSRCETLSGLGQDAHMCTADEIVKSLQCGKSVPDGWYSSGLDASGRLIGGSSGVSNDCEGWYSASAGSNGPVWHNGSPSIDRCSNSYPILCCL